MLKSMFFLFLNKSTQWHIHSRIKNWKKKKNWTHVERVYDDTVSVVLLKFQTKRIHITFIHKQISKKKTNHTVEPEEIYREKRESIWHEFLDKRGPVHSKGFACVCQTLDLVDYVDKVDCLFIHIL